MTELKDHQIAWTVSAVTALARDYGQTQQCRERIAQLLVPILKGQGFPRSVVAAYAMPPTPGVVTDAARPVAWVRRHPDGTLTGELLLDASIEQVRKDSGSWVPLVPAYGVDTCDGGKSNG